MVVEVIQLHSERSLRLRRLRQMSGLSRRKFAQQCGLSAATLQRWETPDLGGVSESGVRQMVDCFARLGITVTYEWVMMGQGVQPQLNNRHAIKSVSPTRSNKKPVRHYAEELAQWRKCCKSGLLYTVKDEAMAPRLIVGDVCMGMLVRTKREQAALVGQLCIVQGVEGDCVARYLTGVYSQSAKVDLLASNSAEEGGNLSQTVSYQKIWKVVMIAFTERSN